MYKVSDCRGIAGSFGGPIFNTSNNDDRQGMINAGVILTAIVNKHFIYGHQLLTGKGYLRDNPNISNMNINSMIIQKASDHVKKAKDAMDKEIYQFLQTGDVTLGFKDEILHTRVTDLERRLNESAVHQAANDALKKRIVVLEEFVNHYTDNMLALEHLLNTLIAQTSVPKVDAATECEEIQETTEAEEAEKIDEVVKEDNSVEFFFLLAAFLGLVANILYIIYKDNFNASR